MSINFRKFTLVAALTAISSTPFLVPAADFTLETEVNLGKGTQTFLDNYLIKLRDNLLAIIKGGFDRGDESMKTTAELLQDAQVCIGVTVEEIPRNWWGRKPNVVEYLKDDVSNSRASAKWDTSPDKFTTLYAGVDDRQRNAFCGTRQDDISRQEIVTLRQSTKLSYMAWSRLRGSCSNSQDCYTRLHQIIQSKLQFSPAQDKQKIKADDRFATLPAPSNLNTQSKSFSIDSYEKPLVELYSINDELNIVAKDRMLSGKPYVDKYNESIGLVKEKINSGLAHERSNSVKGNKEACNCGYRALQLIRDANYNLTYIKKMDLFSSIQLATEENLLTDYSNTATQLSKIKRNIINKHGRCDFYGPFLTR